VREESLTQFIYPEGSGKVGQREREEARGIFESQSVGSQGQYLGAYGDLVRDFSMRGVTVLQYEHTVVAFEIVEDDDDVPIVSVHVDGDGFEVVEHVGGAGGTVEGAKVILFVVF